MVALFRAKRQLDATIYTSCRTGFNYTIFPDGGGYVVASPGANLNLWATSRRDALRLVEISDLASLAN